MKHLLKLADLSTEEIFGILNLADQLKYRAEKRHSASAPCGQKVGHDFYKVIHADARQL